MDTWLADFHQRTDLNRYPVAMRTRGGIGYQVGGLVVSNFVGHPIHYRDGREWKPITLRHENGQFEGCPFAWNGYAVTYKGRILFQPESVTFNGVARPLEFFRKENRLIAYVPAIGTYEIVFSENGVREFLTIPEPLEGVLSFQVHHKAKPQKLHKHPRRLMGVDGIEGDVYTLTKDMNYPLVIDPDYSADTADGVVLGSSTVYATAQSTATNHGTAIDYIYCGQYYSSPNYAVHRVFEKFDTSGIPDGDTIIDVTTTWTVQSDSSATDFDVKIKKCDWSAYDPLASGNRDSAYDDCASAGEDDSIWRNTSGLSTFTAYASGSLSTAWVSKTGYTYYGLMSSREGTTPTGNEFIAFNSANHATPGYRPFLTVTHSGSSNKQSRSLLGVGW